MVKTLVSLAEAAYLRDKQGGSHSGWRFHTHFDVDRRVPLRIDVTTAHNRGKTDEKQQLRGRLEPDRCYVLDRWYAEFALWNEIVPHGSSYVCRVRDNSNLKAVREERTVSATAKAAGVLRDIVVDLGSQATRPDHPVRVVLVQTTPHKKTGGRKGGTAGPPSDGILRISSRWDLQHLRAGRTHSGKAICAGSPPAYASRFCAVRARSAAALSKSPSGSSGTRQSQHCERAMAQPGMTDLPVLRDRPDRVKWLQDHLEAICNEQMISVRLPGEDPKQAAEIVNAAVNTYLDVAPQIEIEQVQKTSTILTDEIDRKQKQLERQQAKIAARSKFTHSNPQTRQLAAERYSSLCGLAAKVHEARLDTELRIATANVQSLQAESDTTQLAKAKLDQSIAEAQHKLPDHAADEIKASLTAIEQEVDNKIEDPFETEWARLNVEVLNASRKELLIRRGKLTSSGVSRITVMRRATSPN